MPIAQALSQESECKGMPPSKRTFPPTARCLGPGGRRKLGVCPGTCGGSSLMQISDILNSRFCIFYTTFEGKEATGLNGQAATSAGSCGVRVEGSLNGVVAEEATASRSKPNGEGVKIGIMESIAAEVEIVLPVGNGAGWGWKVSVIVNPELIMQRRPAVTL